MTWSVNFNPHCTINIHALYNCSIWSNKFSDWTTKYFLTLLSIKINWVKVNDGWENNSRSSPANSRPTSFPPKQRHLEKMGYCWLVYFIRCFLVSILESAKHCVISGKDSSSLTYCHCHHLVFFFSHFQNYTRYSDWRVRVTITLYHRNFCQ